MARRRSGYGALQIIALVLKVFAVLNGIGAAICFVFMLIALASSGGDEGAFSVVGAGLMFFYAFAFIMWGILLWGGAELILLLIDVENNTRRTAEAFASAPAQQPVPQQFTPPAQHEELPDFSQIEPTQSEPAPQPSNGPRAIACPHCKVKINVPAGTPAGRKAKCPKCGNAMIIG